MTRTLKYWLPMMQVVLAAVLLWISDAWTLALMRRSHGMVGSVPTFDFLVSLNAPVALLRMYLGRFITGWWDYIAFVFFIGLFWYWVALNILSVRESRVVTLFRYRPLRVLADLLLAVVGIFLGLTFTTNFYWPIFVFGMRVPQMYHGVTGWKGYAVITSLTLPMAMWSLLLVFLFTQDLYRTVRRRTIR
jgi:hypothetical protein